MEPRVEKLLVKTLTSGDGNLRAAMGNPIVLADKVKWIILNNPLRFYFIEKVKAPLMNAMIMLANLYPKPTKENTDHPISHILLDVFDLFLSYEDNPGREQMFQAGRRVLVGEVEHDSYYRDRGQFLLEEAIKAILDGRWVPRGLGCPSTCWREPSPYGGEYSIIHKLLKHRERIKAILEEG